MTPTFVSMTSVLRAQVEAMQRLAWFLIEHHEREALLALQAWSAPRPAMPTHPGGGMRGRATAAERGRDRA